MKTCPVCKARLFEDMDTCYGCMHRFGEEDPMHADPDEPPASAFPHPDEKEPPARRIRDASKVFACEEAASESRSSGGVPPSGSLPDCGAPAIVPPAGAAPSGAPSPRPPLDLASGAPAGWTIRFELTDRFGPADRAGTDHASADCAGAERVSPDCVLAVDLIPWHSSCSALAGRSCFAVRKELK